MPPSCQNVICHLLLYDAIENGDVSKNLSIDEVETRFADEATYSDEEDNDGQDANVLHARTCESCCTSAHKHTTSHLNVEVDICITNRDQVNTYIAQINR